MRFYTQLSIFLFVTLKITGQAIDTSVAGYYDHFSLFGVCVNLLPDGSFEHILRVDDVGPCDKPDRFFEKGKWFVKNDTIYVHIMQKRTSNIFKNCRDSIFISEKSALGFVGLYHYEDNTLLGGRIKLFKKIAYYPNGLMRFKITIEGGIDRNRQFSKNNYLDTTFYYPNGNEARIVNYNQGNKDGFELTYFPDGKNKSLLYWEKGLKISEIIYYSNGNKQCEGGWYNGFQKDGKWEYFNESGKLIRKEKYKQGVLKKVKIF